MDILKIIMGVNNKETENKIKYLTELENNDSSDYDD